jgi:hypothetical protein
MLAYYWNLWINVGNKFSTFIPITILNARTYTHTHARTKLSLHDPDRTAWQCMVAMHAVLSGSCN